MRGNKPGQDLHFKERCFCKGAGSGRAARLRRGAETKLFELESLGARHRQLHVQGTVKAKLL